MASKLILISAFNAALVGGFVYWQGAGFVLTLAALGAVITGSLAGIRGAREFERRGWTVEQLLGD